MAFSIGSIILEKYKIEKLIGQGAFGDVYLVTHIELNAPFAIKVLQKDAPQLGSSTFSNYHVKFALEAQIGSQIQHPNIIRVTDLVQVENSYVLVMEYASNGTLHQYLEEKREKQETIPLADALRITLDVSSGLSAVHKKKFVHRDIKPKNILFSDEWRAKITDFGLAQMRGGPSNRSQLSQPMSHPGTPEYMSPEQRIITNYLTPASDVYSVGLILYEMLFGEHLSLRETPTLIIKKNIREFAQRNRLPRNFSRKLEALLIKTLAYKPEERFQEAGELEEAIEKLITLSEKTVPRDSVVKLGKQNETKKIGDDEEVSRRVTTGVVVMLSFAVVVLLVFQFRGLFPWINKTSTPTISPSVEVHPVEENPSTPTFTLNATSTPTPTPTSSLTLTPSPSETKIPTATSTPTPSPTFPSTSIPTQVPTIAGPFTIDLDRAITLSNLSDVTAITFSADGSLIASARANLQITIWSSEGNTVESLTGHLIRIDSLAFSHDNSLLASADASSALRIVRISNGDVVASWSAHTQGIAFVGFFFDPSIFAGEILITGGGPFDSEVRRWNPTNGEEIGDEFSGPSGPVRSLDFAPIRKFLAAISTNTSSVFVWKSAGQNVAYRITVPGGVQPRSVQFSPDEQILATGWNDGMVRLWDAADGDPTISFEATSEIVSLAFSPDGKFLAAGLLNGNIYLWDLENEILVDDWNAHDGEILSMIFTTSGNLLTGGKDGQAKVWTINIP